MKKKLSFLSISFILVLSVFLSACGNKQDAGSGNGATGEPQDGGKVTLAMFSAPQGIFNPVFYEDQYDAYVLEYTFDDLFGYDSNLNISTEKSLGDSYKFENDNKTLTIKMKQEAKWHDGKPVTIDDMIFAWEVIADKEYTGPRFSNISMIKGAQEKKDGKADKIAGITKIDDYTVKLELNQAQANTISEIWDYPLAKHLYEGVPIKDMPNAEPTKKNIVGNAEFKVKEIKANEYVVLERNDDYWRGKAHLDQIVLKVVNQDVAIGALKKGDVDFVPQIQPKEFDDLDKNDNVEIKEIGDFGYQYMGINHESTKLQDQKLRQALVYGIDRAAMVKGLLKGHGYVLNQHIPKVSWAYNEGLDDAYPYDVEKAKSILAEAGYKDLNGDGFVEGKDGKAFSLKLDYPTGNPVREQSAPIIKENLEKIGLKIDLQQPREVASHYDAVEQGKTELYLAGWGLVPDPDPSGIFLSTDTFNYLRYKNAESDKLIKAAVTSSDAFDQAKRKEMYKTWTEKINEDVPQVFLYGQNRIEAWNKRVNGVTFDWRGAIESPDAIDWWVAK
ncbi:hypothetical protein IC619_004865 [Hazenella sp. IB182353]|uniref:ABC transporter substrate-binding protein n=1 Tax=Polycladospora coralii TaxID=2771432 RepID=UPI00174728FE|nr:hypothetical protein [Polycladospora coralii]